MIDVNSPEAKLWSENMSLKSENEHLRKLLSEAMDSRAPDYADAAHPGWSTLARNALAPEQSRDTKELP